MQFPQRCVASYIYACWLGCCVRGIPWYHTIPHALKRTRVCVWLIEGNVQGEGHCWNFISFIWEGLESSIFQFNNKNYWNNTFIHCKFWAGWSSLYCIGQEFLDDDAELSIPSIYLLCQPNVHQIHINNKGNNATCFGRNRRTLESTVCQY